MISAISSAAQTQPVAQSAGPSTQKPAKPTPQSAPMDTVRLSSTAQARLAALQEVRETPAQTTKEAGQGDRQAQRLLAKESAKSITK